MSMNGSENRFPPSNGSQFSPEQVVRIDVPTQQTNFAALSESYLSVALQGCTDDNAQSATLNLGAGIYALIRDIRILVNGQIVETVNNVEEFANMKLALSENANGINGYRQIVQEGINDYIIGEQGVVTAATAPKHLYNINLGVFSGLFAKYSTFPLYLCDSFQMELTLNPAAIVVRAAAGTTDYIASDWYLVLKEKRLPDDVRDAYTAELEDRFSKDGVSLNFITYERALNNVSSSETSAVLDLYGSCQHSDCVALLSIPASLAARASLTDSNKFNGVKDGATQYQWSIDGQLTPNQPVSVVRAKPQLAMSELKAALHSVDSQLTAYENIDGTYIWYGRSLAGKGRSMDLRGKQVQLQVEYSGPAVNKQFYTYVAFVRRLLLKRGQVSIYD